MDYQNSPSEIIIEDLVSAWTEFFKVVNYEAHNLTNEQIQDYLKLFGFPDVDAEYSSSLQFMLRLCDEVEREKKEYGYIDVEKVYNHMYEDCSESTLLNLFGELICDSYYYDCGKAMCGITDQICPCNGLYEKCPDKM